MTRDEMIRAVGCRLSKDWPADDIGTVIDALETIHLVKCDPPPKTPREKAIAALLYLQLRMQGERSQTMQITAAQAEIIVSRLEERGVSFVMAARA